MFWSVWPCLSKKWGCGLLISEGSDNNYFAYRRPSVVIRRNWRGKYKQLHIKESKAGSSLTSRSVLPATLIGTLRSSHCTRSTPTTQRRNNHFLSEWKSCMGQDRGWSAAKVVSCDLGTTSGTRVYAYSFSSIIVDGACNLRCKLEKWMLPLLHLLSSTTFSVWPG